MITLPEETVQNLIKKRRRHGHLMLLFEVIHGIIFLYFARLHHGKPGEVITFISSLFYKQLASWKTAFPVMADVFPYTLTSSYIFAAIQLVSTVIFYNKYYILTRALNSPGIKVSRGVFFFFFITNILAIVSFFTIYIDPTIILNSPNDSYRNQTLKIIYLTHIIVVYCTIFSYMLLYAGFRSIYELLFNKY